MGERNHKCEKKMKIIRCGSLETPTEIRNLDREINEEKQMCVLYKRKI